MQVARAEFKFKAIARQAARAEAHCGFICIKPNAHTSKTQALMYK
jgi:hypothetical protein